MAVVAFSIPPILWWWVVGGGWSWVVVSNRGWSWGGSEGGEGLEVEGEKTRNVAPEVMGVTGVTGVTG